MLGLFTGNVLINKQTVTGYSSHTHPLTNMHTHKSVTYTHVSTYTYTHIHRFLRF